jgi:hypothetical protein
LVLCAGPPPVPGPGGPGDDSGLAIRDVPSGDYSDFGQYFSKHVDVFGVHIFATAATPDDKVLHAAHVLAQYLDNDEDGSPDNAALVTEMTGQPGGASLVMFATENDVENSGIFESDLPDRFPMQDLFGEETHPEGSSRDGGFDATLEEVLHLVSSKGHSNLYPDIFGEQTGSAIADAMDLARGGQFQGVPASYPSGAWYHYDDTTCDYPCQVTEYFYWALTSILGAQDYAGRCQDIAVEWELCSRELVQNGDPAVYGLLTDPGYSLPTVLPDGSYRTD